MSTSNEISFLKDVLYGVDWTEPWLICLLVFHVMTFVAIILLRHHIYLQACILSILGILCVATETVNEYAALNHQKFAGQQYFDSGGFFILTVYAAPMLFNCFLIVLCWLYHVWDTMVRVGKLKAKKQLKNKQDSPRTRDRTIKKKQ